jgi:hypothetical protein
MVVISQSQWLWGIRHGYVSAWLLGLRVWMDVCLFWVSRVVRQRSLQRVDHLSRGVIPTVMLRFVLPRHLKNEEAMARIGTQHGRKKKILIRCNWVSLFYPVYAVCVLKLLKLDEKCTFTYIYCRKTGKVGSRYYSCVVTGVLIWVELKRLVLGFKPFKPRIKSHLLFAGIISSRFSPR